MNRKFADRLRVPTKSPLTRPRASSPFEPRLFSAPHPRAESAPKAPEGPNLFEAYLRRRRIVSSGTRSASSRESSPFSSPVQPKRTVDPPGALAPGPPIQRYLVLGKGDDPETDFKKADQPLNIEGNVPGFFPSQISDKQNNYMTVVNKTSLEAESVKVADTLDMAIENVKEPKAFFGTGKIIAESNKILAAVHSAYELVPQGKTLVVARGPDRFGLRQIMPRNRITDTEGPSTTSLHRCNEMAKRVMGIHYNQGTKPKLEGSKTEVSERPAQIAEHVLGAESAFEKTLKDPEFISSYAKLDERERDELARATGINEYADPKIGEAFQTHSVGETTKEWNYHWAGVVAKTGSDYVTLEDYNRDTETQASAARGEDVGTSWFFQMYGKEIKEQTFHQSNASSDNFLNPLTLRQTKDSEKQAAQDVAMSGVDLTDKAQVRDALRRQLGIQDEETARETMEAAQETSALGPIEIIYDEKMSDGEKLRQLATLAGVPSDKIESTVALAQKQIGGELAPFNVKFVFQKFCTLKMGLASARFNEEMWQRWIEE